MTWFRFLVPPIGLLLVVAAIMVVRALSLGGAGEAYAPKAVRADAGGAAARLAAAIRLQTISGRNREAFAGFADFLQTSYPCTHERLVREIVDGGGLIYRWAGTDPARAPVGLIAHSDVVPVEPGTEDEWRHPPFDGVIADGKVWGRGALDNKGQLIAIMEAVEMLCTEGAAPARDIYLLFGHDEELGGAAGAGAMASRLVARGVRFAFTLDEGSGIVDGVVPNMARPMALIATAEKGSTTLRLTARAPGGHSSTPARDTAITILARAIVALNDHPHPMEIDAPVVAFLHAVAREGGFAQRLVLGNLWLTGGLVKGRLGASPVTAASLHTTTAPTIIEGGAKVNILPQQASALVNYRVHPRDTPTIVAERAARLINDERVTIEVVSATAPSPRSSTASAGYAAIEASIAEIFGPIATAPFLTLQGTDSKHYVEMADDLYRFTPFVYESADLQRIHGTDERIDIETLARAIDWYKEFITNAAQGK